MEPVLLGDDIASGMALTKPRFFHDFAVIFATIAPRSGRDQGLIVRRLGVDPAADPQENAF